MHDVQTVELEIRERRGHRGGDLGCAGALDLEPETTPARNHEQVDFRPRVRAPEETLLGPRLDYLEISVSSTEISR